MKLRFVDWTARRFYLAVELQWEPRDLWVGAFWTFNRWSGITGADSKHGAYIARPWTMRVYICILPMVPIHVYIDRTIRP